MQQKNTKLNNNTISLFSFMLFYNNNNLRILHNILLLIYRNISYLICILITQLFIIIIT